jgi:serine/threonine protein kinase
MQDRSENHPSPDQLRAFDLGRLASTEWSAVEHHLLECPECSGQIQELPEQTLADLLGEYDPERPSGETPAGPATPPGPAFSPPVAEPELPPELAEHPRYRLLGYLGAGGMGMVFKAEHRLMRRTVSLKVIHRHLLNRPAAVERFRREVRAAAQLAHPNIVTAHDAEQAGAAHFLVMEFVEGETLDRIVDRRGPLLVAEACGYVRQAALGLQHAHEQKMVHRDLKPANLIVTPEGRVKILDFGLAQLAHELASGPGLTPDGAVVGTPWYLAPEQAREPGTADIRADLYSLGCTLYHLLAGRPPFSGEGLLQQLLAHQERVPRSLTAYRSDVPPALVQVVERLLAKEPADRVQSPAQLVAALAPFTREVGSACVAKQDRGGHRLPVVLTTLGFLVIIGGGLLIWHLTAGKNAFSQKQSNAENGSRPAETSLTSPRKKAVVVWADIPSARDRAVAWLAENNRLGPGHPVVSDMARMIDRDAKDGQAFLIRLGLELVKSGKPTQLAGRHHDLYAFTFEPEQAPDWVPPKASDFCTSTVPRQEIHSHPLVRLSLPRIDQPGALDPLTDIKGSIDYERLDEVTGTLTLRLTCITARGTRTVFEAMPELKLSERGRISFSLHPLFDSKDIEPVPRGAAIFFLELGRWPTPGSDAQMVLLSNMVATPVFFRR